MTVRRGFVDVAEGQVHYRTNVKEDGSAPQGVPLIVLHAAPATAFVLTRYIEEIGKTRPVYALDNLGMGDSSPPAPADPDTAYFADATLRAIDGLGIERFDLHGLLTGARAAVEIAIREPARVRKLVIDRMGILSAEEKAEWLANFCPKVEPDAQGNQFRFAWQFVRDEFIFFPWYKRDAAHRLQRDVPDADHMHDKVVEMLKGIRTYHLFIRAGLEYPVTEKLPQITVPTLATEEVQPHVPGAIKKTNPGMPDMGYQPIEAIRANAAEIAAFLDA